ncbi:MAG: antitoxin Xre/MbcA/ParS toxin-binding domain-containing protein [Chitinophagales bacterium]
MSVAAVKTKHEHPAHSSIFLRYDKSIRDLFTIVVEAKKGVNARAFFDVVSISGIDRNKLADLMNVSLKTLLRYKQQNKKLSATKSERVLKLIALYKKGNEIFGDTHAFRRWVEKPAYGLGSMTPIELMHTSGGIDLIQEELSRIEFGEVA